MNKEEKIQQLINLTKERQKFEGYLDNDFYPFYYSGFGDPRRLREETDIDSKVNKLVKKELQKKLKSINNQIAEFKID